MTTKISTHSTGQRLQKMRTGDRIVSMQEAIDYLKKRKYVKFTAQTIRELKLFPWATSDRTIVKIIEQDTHFGENILRAQIYGEGRQRRYYIKGAHIISYLKKYGPALMREPRPKHHEKTKSNEATGNKKSRPQDPEDRAEGVIE